MTPRERGKRVRARINGINVGVEEHTATGVRLPTTTGGKARGGTHEIGAGLRDIGCGIVRPGIGHKYIDSRRSNTLAVAGVLLLAAVIQVAVRIELCNVNTFSFELEKMQIAIIAAIPRLRRCRRSRGRCRRLRRRPPPRFRRHRWVAS